MTLTDSIQTQLSLADSLTVSRHAEPSWPVTPGLSVAYCSFQLDHLVRNIDPPKARQIVGNIFGHLLRLLGTLRPIEAHLHEIDESEETFAQLQFICDDVSALVQFIQEDALTSEALNKELCDTLDAISFAVNHDLQRVFESKRPAVTEETTDREIAGKLFRAHDLLTNCLQQAIVSLATVFDPELVGTKLFSELDTRYRRSVQLCEDLSTLLRLIEACGGTRKERAFAKLTAALQEFHIESMERLRYSDWPEFESFCERIQIAATTPDLEPVLHQFHCYIETLIGQVKMRAVLANEFRIEFEADDLQESSSSPCISATQFYSSDELQDDSVRRDTLAIAM